MRYVTLESDYEQFTQVQSLLRDMANTVASIYKSELVKKDIEIEISHFGREFCENIDLLELDVKQSEFSSPRLFYFAIREHGVEGGTKECCKERCDRLGSPVVIVKVEYLSRFKFHITMRVRCIENY